MINPEMTVFKDVHKGETGICFGTGPTINEYKDKDGYVKFGSNEIIYKPFVMDYYFLGDPGDKNRGYISDKESYKKYIPKKGKFFRCPSGSYSGIKDKYDDVIYYTVTDGPQKKGCLKPDIENGFYGYATISLEVMQFALYTGVKKIYLIGHDCNYNQGSFYSQCSQNAKHIIKAWDKLKSFIISHYPDVEVKIVNPVSLKIFPEETWSQ